jgi:GT2 family glycosyltransferase
VTVDAILRGAPLPPVPKKERRRLAKRHRKFILDPLWRALRLRRIYEKPGLKGVTFGVWREDYEAVNGFDEVFRGWGCEDDDFGARLRQAGVRIRSLIRRSVLCHLWHPPAASAPAQWKDNVNRSYYLRPGRLCRASNGLVKPVAS